MDLLFGLLALFLLVLCVFGYVVLNDLRELRGVFYDQSDRIVRAIKDPRPDAQPRPKWFVETSEDGEGHDVRADAMWLDEDGTLKAVNNDGSVVGLFLPGKWVAYSKY